MYITSLIGRFLFPACCGLGLCCCLYRLHFGIRIGRRSLPLVAFLWLHRDWLGFILDPSWFILLQFGAPGASSEWHFVGIEYER